jgi:hypothetical protein
MTEAALADEESQNRLGASLRTNVPAWDGSTDAIERRIKASQRLGFEDEAMRDSLTVLVGATHDVAEAQRIQAIAMDLARFKGIDLKTASEALIKVEGGAYRSLKQLGISLRDGATSTEALAAVQKVAAGQAEAYAATNRGKLTASSIELDEAMENLGSKTMPIVVEVVQAAAETASDLADQIGNVTDKLGDLGEEADGSKGPLSKVWELLNVPLTPTIDKRDFTEVAADLISDLLGIDNKFDDTALAFEENADASAGWADKLRHSAGVGGDAIETVGTRAKRTVRVVNRSLGSMSDAFDKTWSELSGAADQAADDIFGPIERRAELSANRLAQGAAMGDINKPRQKGETGAEFTERVAGARQELLGLQKDFFALTAEMAGRGELTAGELSKLTAALKDELKTASLEEQTSILALIALLDRLRAKSKGIFTAGNINIRSTGSGQAGQGGRAAGGPVVGNRPVVVGEKGPEVFVPEGAGTVLPNAGSGRPVAPTGDGGALLAEAKLTNRLLARVVAQEPAAARPQTARGQLARDSALMPGGRL